jgi:hypothetical protein
MVQAYNEQPYSKETQELLDRAQTAINRSIHIRNEHAAYLEAAKRKAFEVELGIYRLRAAGLSSLLKN